MKKVNRIISAIVLAAFLCNTFLVDASFAQDILRNGSSSTLSVALRSDDMLGVERQDISKISIWFRGCIDLISKKNQPVNLASLRDPKILPNDVIDGLKDFKFLRHSDLSQDTVTGVIRVKVRRRAGLSMKTYWAEYLPSEGRLRVYPDGAQVSLFAPHRSPAPNAREFDILGKAGPGGKHTNFDAAARHTVGMAEAPAKSLTEPGKNAKVLHGAALTKFVTESIPALAFAPLMPDIAPPLDILGFEFESCLTNATADDVPALQKASQELHNSPGYSGLKPGSIALGAMQGLLKELDDRIGTLSKQAQPAPTAKAPAQAARPERPDVLGKAGPGGDHSNFDVAARHTVGMPQVPAADKPTDDLDLTPLEESLVEIRIALSEAALIKGVQEVRLWQNHQGSVSRIAQFDVEDGIPVAKGMESGRWEGIIQDRFPDGGKVRIGSDSDSLLNMAAPLEPHDAPLKVISVVIEDAVTPSPMGKPGKPDVRGEVGSGSEDGRIPPGADIWIAQGVTSQVLAEEVVRFTGDAEGSHDKTAGARESMAIRMLATYIIEHPNLAKYNLSIKLEKVGKPFFPSNLGQFSASSFSGVMGSRIRNGDKVKLTISGLPVEGMNEKAKALLGVLKKLLGAYTPAEKLDALKAEIDAIANAPAATVKRTKAINEIWKGLSGQTDIRKPINLFTESMIEDDWVRVAVGSLAEEMIAGIEGLKIYSKAGEVPDVWGSTDIHEIYLKLTFKARLNSIRDRNLSARKLKAVKEWLIQESRKLAALDTSLNNTLLPLLSPVETMPETPAPVAAQELDNLGKQLEAQEAAEVKTVMGYVAILADTSETQARREEIHAKLVQEIKGNYRVTAIALVGLIAAGSNNARILEDTLLTNGPWAKTYEPVPQDIPKRFYVLAHALCMNYELLWRDFNESVEYMDRGKFDNVILSLNDYLATIENPRVYPEMPAQDRGRIVSTIKYILNALPPFRGELELSLMGNEMSDRLRIGFGNYYTRVYYNEAPIIGGPDSSLSSELWKGSSLVTIGLDTNGEQVVVVEDKFLEFVRKFFSKQMSNGRPVDMSKFPSTIVGESDARAKGLRPLIPERSLEAPAELKNLPAQMPVKKDDGYYVTIAGKSLAITADIACLLKGNPARHDGWRRKLAPAKVRKELNRLKEIIATRPLDMSLSGIKTLLETENFKYIQLDTLTDVSAVTKDRVAYEDGHGVPCLPSCNAGPIKYLVIAKYSKGIIRKKEYILPIVLALDARILHSRARDFVLSAFVCPKSLSDVLYIVKAGMFGAYATSASPAAETPAPAAASLDEANARARAREETAHELVFHIVHSGRASIQLPFIVDELSRFNNVTKFRLFIELLSAELRAGRRFENKEITQELLDRVVFDTLVRRYAETPAFAGPVPELMAAMRPILIDLDVQMIGCQVSIERNGESVIISITNPADKKDVMGFQLNKYVDGERISFTITPFRNKTFYKMESASSETEFIGLVKTVLERFKSYAYWKEWLKSAQEEETIFSVEPAAASAPTGTFQPDVAFVYALSAGTPAPAVPAAAPATENVAKPVPTPVVTTSPASSEEHDVTLLDILAHKIILLRVRQWFGKRKLSENQVLELLRTDKAFAREYLSNFIETLEESPGIEYFEMDLINGVGWHSDVNGYPFEGIKSALRSIAETILQSGIVISDKLKSDLRYYLEQSRQALVAPAPSKKVTDFVALIQRAVWGRGITTYSGDRFTVDTAVENGPTGFPDAGQANQSAILKAIEKQIAETRDLRMLQAAKGLIEARQVSSPQAVPTESISESQAFGEYIAKLEDRIRVVRASPKDGGEDAHFFSERVPHMTATELAHYVMNSSIGYVQACIAIRVLSNPGHEALLKGFLEKLYSELGIKNAIDTHLTRIKVDAYIIELNSHKKSVPAAKSIIAKPSAPAATPAPAAVLSALPSSNPPNVASVHRINTRPKHIAPEEFGDKINSLPGGTVFNQNVLTDRKIQVGDTEIYCGWSENYGDGQGLVHITSKAADLAEEDAVIASLRLNRRVDTSKFQPSYFNLDFIKRGALDNKPHFSMTNKNGTRIDYEGYPLVTFGFKGPLMVFVMTDEYYEYLIGKNFDNFVGVTNDKVGWIVVSESQAVQNYEYFKDWFGWEDSKMPVAETLTPAATPAPAAEPDQAAAGTVITVGGETLKLRETSERKLFPRGVRKELNRLRETIFGVMEKEGASFNDIKAALAAQDFKFLDAATFTDISSLTEDKLHEYYSGSFEDALDLMGRIQYMVALRYRAGISRRLHTAIVVLASGRAAIHMTGNPNFMLCKAIEDASIPAAQRLIAQQTHSAETVAAAEEILSAQRISSMTADGLAAYVMKAEKGSTYVPDILRLFTPTSSTLTGFIASLSKKLVLAKPADIGLTIRSLASALRKLAEVPGSVSAQLDPSISPGEWTIETKQMLFKRYTSLFEGQSGIKDELRNIIDLISRPGGLRPSVNKLNMDIHNGVYGVASHILPSIYYMGAGDKEYYPLLVRDDFGNMIPLAIEKISAQDGEEKIKEEYSTYIISEMPDDDIRFMIGNSSAGEPAFVTDLWLDYLDLRYLAAYCGTTEAGPAATPAPAQNDTVRAHLRDIAARIVPANGGILAADESTGTAGKRLESVGLPNTPENRQTMRQLILTVPGQEKAGVSAVILYGETFDNVSKNDENLVQEHLVKRGILPGIKTDAGLIDDPDSPGEKLPDPKGLQKLPELLAKYKAKGAVFTKWRVTLSIDTVKGLPTDANIRKNAVVLANSAKQTQEAGLVPIIEPEVLLDGSHDIAASYKATTRTLEIVFEELAKAGVWLDGAVLKTSMILSGNKAVNRADANTVGYQTLKGLLKTVPQEVPAIVFLSGGQEDDEANNNLNAVTVTSQTKFETVRDEAAAELKTEGKTEAAAKLSQLTQVPWQLSYSFGRGLQRPGLKAWAGKSENFEKAQGALLEAARTTQKARLGLLRAWPRPSEVPEDKRVVVLISGGESAGVNNYFAQLAVGLAEQGYSLEVVRFGLDGLVQPREEFAKNLVWIDEKRSYSIINMPGAVEGTARVSLSDEKHPEYMLNAIANLKGYCKTVIMVGGSDHMAEATKISNELRAQGTNDMVVMALPKSIDYDAPNVYMVGADTAGSYANKFVIRAAPMPGESKVVVSEIMGRDSGYLTIRAADMNTADRSGYAEAELRKMKAVAPTVIALTPEWSVDEKGASVVSLTDVVNAVKRRMDKYGAATVVVSEGFRISPDDELLRRILENPFFKDKFTNVKKDKQGNLLFNEIGIGNFVTEALSIALGEELRLEREKNLLYELPGYSFRCVQPGEIDMAVVDSITAKAVDMIINRRDEIIQRGGVCIATRRGIKSASDIKAEVRDLPKPKEGTVSLKDFVIFTKDELASKNVLGLADESMPLPDMGPAASLPAFQGKELSVLVEALNSQSESARDMKRLNICTIAGQDADMLISRVASHKPVSLAESYVHERTSGAVMYVTAGQSGSLSLGRLIDEINQLYTTNQYGIRFANVVISANVLFKENDETLVRLQKDNPSFAALVAAAKKDADGFLNFGRHIADVVTMALSIDKKISGIRKNVLGESLNSLPQVAPAPEVAIESSVSVLQGIMKLVQAEWLDGWLNFEGLARAVQLAECQGKIITDDDNSTMIFSEISTFGKRNEDGTYEEGLGIILPSLVKSDVRVAVVATTSQQKALIDELNAGLTEGERIIYADSVPEVMAKVKTARYYYFKVASEADAGTGVTSITIIVKKILDAIGKVADIINSTVVEQMHEAARQFAVAA